MNLESVVSARIHPAIGLARVGNSLQEFFVGPELPNPVPSPTGGYRDVEGRLKRQAARFRIYGYDANGEVASELTAANADIIWTVHVANKKAAWYEFVIAFDIPEAAAFTAARRNAFVQALDRRNLIIDPGPRSISGRAAAPQPFENGRFFESPVYLGELRTDEEGRLLFLAGRGVSGAPFGHKLTTFANNAGWYDDISDGPVTATVSINGRDIPVEPAWVVAGPPNYAPDIVSTQTMYDVVYDALQTRWPSSGTPSFTRDIYPLLRQLTDTQWVNYGFFVRFGWQSPFDFTRTDLTAQLAAPGPEYQALRRLILSMFRNPEAAKFDPQQWPLIYGDAYDNAPGSPRMGFAVTKTLYGYLQRWAEGDFLADYDPSRPVPASIDEIPLPQQPATLDSAALHRCMGGPFHPGCEMTWPMRRESMYSSPFRLRHRPGDLPEEDYGEFLTQAVALAENGPLTMNGPGDITRWMGIPWQTDTASCRAGYDQQYDPYIPTFWPARVPNHVLRHENYQFVVDKAMPLEARTVSFNSRANWLRALDLNASYLEQITNMVTMFGELGIVLAHPGPVDDPAFPPIIYVEEQRPAPASNSPAPSGDSFIETFRKVRFGRPRVAYRK